MIRGPEGGCVCMVDGRGGLVKKIKKQREGDMGGGEGGGSR